MIKTKLFKGFALGLCLSMLFTGAAFARTGGGTGEKKTDPLSKKQEEIDHYVFIDHTEDIKKAGFEVVYTGVADTFVEIGINPYNNENANYLYKIFGKDIVKVVESEEATLYTATGEKNSENDPKALTADAAEPDLRTGQGADTPEAGPEKSASKENVSEKPGEEGTGQMTEEDQKLEIQIESLPEGKNFTGADDSMVEKGEEPTGQSGTAEDGQKTQLISAPEEQSDLAAAANVSDEAEGLSAPVTILLIAGGAMILGGAVLLVMKKRNK